MGRSASHIALEVALKVHPNICLISEEVAAQNWTLDQIIEQMAKVVADRAAKKMNYGVAVVPEGLLEFIPEMKKLIAELNDLLAHNARVRKVGNAGRQNRLRARTAWGRNPKAPFSPCPIPSRPNSWLIGTRMGMFKSPRSRPRNSSSRRWSHKLKQWKKEGKYPGQILGPGPFFRL